MEKKLMPKEVINIAVHSGVLNNINYKPEFTEENKVTDLRIPDTGLGVLEVIDTDERLVLTSPWVDTLLKKDRYYDLLISQNMTDASTWEEKVCNRERLNMKLSSIRITSGENPQEVIYTFDKEDKYNTKIKLNDLKLKKDDLTTLLSLTMEMLKNSGDYNKN